MTKQEPNFENKTKKTSMPITITTNINPCKYVFVNKTNPLASLYLKMSQKIQSKKNINIKSSSNLLNLNSDDSSKNDISNNSLKLSNYSNYSMVKNLKTNNISGYNTNRPTNPEQKIITKKNYPIHVNLNRNHASSLSNFVLSTKNNNNKSKKINYESNKNMNKLNNSNFSNPNYCWSTKNKFYQKKEKNSDLKKIKNNKKAKKFKILFKERKNSNNLSTTFSNLNTNTNTNLNNTNGKSLQKSENKYISNISQKNRIKQAINNNRKNAQHYRYNTMLLDEKEINDILKKNKNDISKHKISSYNSKPQITHNNESAFYLNLNKKNEIKKKLNSTKNLINAELINSHIKNALPSNGRLSVNNMNLFSREKNGNQKQNKKPINKNNILKNKKDSTSNNPIMGRKIKINKNEILKEIKNKMDSKNIHLKNNQNKKKPKNLQEKIQEFSKIIVLDEDKFKKTSINFYTKKDNNRVLKLNNNESYFNRTKRESLSNKNNNIIISNSKSIKSTKIEKINSFKQKKLNNCTFNDNIEQRTVNAYTNIENDNAQKYCLPNNYSTTYFPFMNQKKLNQKKPLIKITTNDNLSFNNNTYMFNREFSNTSVINNFEMMNCKQNELLLKDNNLIIKKKRNIGNNSFYINKRLMSYSSKEFKNKNLEIKNILFDNNNISKLPENYDEKFDDLYAIIHKMNFCSVLIGAESIFSLNSKKYRDYQYNFDLGFMKKYNKFNSVENNGKVIKKITNSGSTKTDFSSSNKNIYKNIQNNYFIPNEFEISELM